MMSLILAAMFVAGVRLEIGGTSWRDHTVAALGDGACFVFFGALALTALAGTASIDAKRRRAFGRAWESFAAQTSITPFAAIVADRNRFRLAEIDPWLGSPPSSLTP
jgi:uncharacterized membrane protein